MPYSGPQLKPRTLRKAATTTLTPLTFKRLPKHLRSLRPLPSTSAFSSITSPSRPQPSAPGETCPGAVQLASTPGKPAARSWLSSNRSLQMPWHLGGWAQHPAKASVHEHQHIHPTRASGWVTCEASIPAGREPVLSFSLNWSHFKHTNTSNDSPGWG